MFKCFNNGNSIIVGIKLTKNSNESELIDIFSNVFSSYGYNRELFALIDCRQNNKGINDLSKYQILQMVGAPVHTFINKQVLFSSKGKSNIISAFIETANKIKKITLIFSTDIKNAQNWILQQKPICEKSLC